MNIFSFKKMAILFHILIGLLFQVSYSSQQYPCPGQCQPSVINLSSLYQNLINGNFPKLPVTQTADVPQYVMSRNQQPVCLTPRSSGFCYDPLRELCKKLNRLDNKICQLCAGQGGTPARLEMKPAEEELVKFERMQALPHSEEVEDEKDVNDNEPFINEDPFKNPSNRRIHPHDRRNKERFSEEMEHYTSELFDSNQDAVSKEEHILEGHKHMYNTDVIKSRSITKSESRKPIVDKDETEESYAISLNNNLGTYATEDKYTRLRGRYQRTRRNRRKHPRRRRRRKPKRPIIDYQSDYKYENIKIDDREDKFPKAEESVSNNRYKKQRSGQKKNSKRYNYVSTQEIEEDKRAIAKKILNERPRKRNRNEIQYAQDDQIKNDDQNVHKGKKEEQENDKQTVIKEEINTQPQNNAQEIPLRKTKHAKKTDDVNQIKGRNKDKKEIEQSDFEDGETSSKFKSKDKPNFYNENNKNEDIKPSDDEKEQKGDACKTKQDYADVQNENNENLEVDISLQNSSKEKQGYENNANFEIQDVDITLENLLNEKQRFEKDKNCEDSKQPDAQTKNTSIDEDDRKEEIQQCDDAKETTEEQLEDASETKEDDTGFLTKDDVTLGVGVLLENPLNEKQAKEIDENCEDKSQSDVQAESTANKNDDQHEEVRPCDDTQETPEKQIKYLNEANQDDPSILNKDEVIVADTLENSPIKKHGSKNDAHWEDNKQSHAQSKEISSDGDGKNEEIQPCDDAIETTEEQAENATKTTEGDTGIQTKNDVNLGVNISLENLMKEKQGIEEVEDGENIGQSNARPKDTSSYEKDKYRDIQPCADTKETPDEKKEEASETKQDDMGIPNNDNLTMKVFSSLEKSSKQGSEEGDKCEDNEQSESQAEDTAKDTSSDQNDKNKEMQSFDESKVTLEKQTNDESKMNQEDTDVDIRNDAILEVDILLEKSSNETQRPEEDEHCEDNEQSDAQAKDTSSSADEKNEVTQPGDDDKETRLTQHEDAIQIKEDNTGIPTNDDVTLDVDIISKYSRNEKQGYENIKNCDGNGQSDAQVENTEGEIDDQNEPSDDSYETHEKQTENLSEANQYVTGVSTEDSFIHEGDISLENSPKEQHGTKENEHCEDIDQSDAPAEDISSDEDDNNEKIQSCDDSKESLEKQREETSEAKQDDTGVTTKNDVILEGSFSFESPSKERQRIEEDEYYEDNVQSEAKAEDNAENTSNDKEEKNKEILPFDDSKETPENLTEGESERKQVDTGLPTKDDVIPEVGILSKNSSKETQRTAVDEKCDDNEPSDAQVKYTSSDMDVKTEEIQRYDDIKETTGEQSEYANLTREDETGDPIKDDINVDVKTSLENSSQEKQVAKEDINSAYIEQSDAQAEDTSSDMDKEAEEMEPCDDEKESTEEQSADVSETKVGDTGIPTKDDVNLEVNISLESSTKEKQGTEKEKTWDDMGQSDARPEYTTGDEDNRYKEIQLCDNSKESPEKETEEESETKQDDTCVPTEDDVTLVVEILSENSLNETQRSEENENCDYSEQSDAKAKYTSSDMDIKTEAIQRYDDAEETTGEQPEYANLTREDETGDPTKDDVNVEVKISLKNPSKEKQVPEEGINTEDIEQSDAQAEETFTHMDETAKEIETCDDEKECTEEQPVDLSETKVDDTSVPTKDDVNLEVNISLESSTKEKQRNEKVENWDDMGQSDARPEYTTGDEDNRYKEIQPCDDSKESPEKETEEESETTQNDTGVPTEDDVTLVVEFLSENSLNETQRSEENENCDYNEQSDAKAIYTSSDMDIKTEAIQRYDDTEETTGEQPEYANLTREDETGDPTKDDVNVEQKISLKNPSKEKQVPEEGINTEGIEQSGAQAEETFKDMDETAKEIETCDDEKECTEEQPVELSETKVDDTGVPTKDDVNLEVTISLESSTKEKQGTEKVENWDDMGQSDVRPEYTSGGEHNRYKEIQPRDDLKDSPEKETEEASETKQDDTGVPTEDGVTLVVELLSENSLNETQRSEEDKNCDYNEQSDAKAISSDMDITTEEIQRYDDGEETTGGQPECANLTREDETGDPTKDDVNVGLNISLKNPSKEKQVPEEGINTEGIEQSDAQAEETFRDMNETAKEIETCDDEKECTEEQPVELSETKVDDTGVPTKDDINLEVNISLESSTKEKQGTEKVENWDDMGQSDVRPEYTSDDEHNRYKEIQPRDDSKDSPEKETEEASETKQDDTGVPAEDGVTLVVELLSENSLNETQRSEEDKNCDYNEQSDAKATSSDMDITTEEIQRYDDGEETTGGQPEYANLTREDETGDPTKDDVNVGLNISLKNLSKEKQVPEEDVNTEDIEQSNTQAKYTTSEIDVQTVEIQRYDDGKETTTEQPEYANLTREDETSDLIKDDVDVEVNLPLENSSQEKEVAEKDINSEDINQSDAQAEDTSSEMDEKAEEIELCEDEKESTEEQPDDGSETKVDVTGVPTKDDVNLEMNISLESSTKEKQGTEEVENYDYMGQCDARPEYTSGDEDDRYKEIQPCDDSKESPEKETEEERETKQDNTGVPNKDDISLEVDLLSENALKETQRPEEDDNEQSGAQIKHTSSDMDEQTKEIKRYEDGKETTGEHPEYVNLTREDETGDPTKDDVNVDVNTPLESSSQEKQIAKEDINSGYIEQSDAQIEDTSSDMDEKAEEIERYDYKKESTAELSEDGSETKDDVTGVTMKNDVNLEMNISLESSTTEKQGTKELENFHKDNVNLEVNILLESSTTGKQGTDEVENINDMDQSDIRPDDTFGDEYERYKEIQPRDNSKESPEKQTEEESETKQDDSGIPTKDDITLEVDLISENSLKETNRSEEDAHCDVNEQSDAQAKYSSSDMDVKTEEIQRYDDDKETTGEQPEYANLTREDETGDPTKDDVNVDVNIPLESLSQEKQVAKEDINSGYIEQSDAQIEDTSSDMDEKAEKIERYDDKRESTAEQSEDGSETKDDVTDVTMKNDVNLEMNISLESSTTEKQGTQELENFHKDDVNLEVNILLESSTTGKQGTDEVENFNDMDQSDIRSDDTFGDEYERYKEIQPRDNSKESPEKQTEEESETKQDDSGIPTKDDITLEVDLISENSVKETNRSEEDEHCDVNEQSDAQAKYSSSDMDVKTEEIQRYDDDKEITGEQPEYANLTREDNTGDATKDDVNVEVNISLGNSSQEKQLFEKDMNSEDIEQSDAQAEDTSSHKDDAKYEMQPCDDEKESTEEQPEVGSETKGDATGDKEDATKDDVNLEVNILSESSTTEKQGTEEVEHCNDMCQSDARLEDTSGDEDDIYKEIQQCDNSKETPECESETKQDDTGIPTEDDVTLEVDLLSQNSLKETQRSEEDDNFNDNEQSDAKAKYTSSDMDVKTKEIQRYEDGNETTGKQPEYANRTREEETGDLTKDDVIVEVNISFENYSQEKQDAEEDVNFEDIELSDAQAKDISSHEDKNDEIQPWDDGKESTEKQPEVGSETKEDDAGVPTKDDVNLEVNVPLESSSTEKRGTEEVDNCDDMGQSDARPEDTSGDDDDRYKEIQPCDDSKDTPEKQSEDESEMEQDDIGVLIEDDVTLKVDLLSKKLLKETQRSEEDENCNDNEQSEAQAKYTSSYMDAKTEEIQPYDDGKETTEEQPEYANQTRENGTSIRTNENVNVEENNSLENSSKENTNRSSEDQREEASETKQDETGTQTNGDVNLEVNISLESSTEEKQGTEKVENYDDIAHSDARLEYTSIYEDDKNDKIQPCDDEKEITAEQPEDAIEIKKDDTFVRVNDNITLGVGILVENSSNEIQRTADHENCQDNAQPDGTSSKNYVQNYEIQPHDDTKGISEKQAEHLSEAKPDVTDYLSEDGVILGVDISSENSMKEKLGYNEDENCEDNAKYIAQSDDDTPRNEIDKNKEIHPSDDTTREAHETKQIDTSNPTEDHITLNVSISLKNLSEEKLGSGYVNCENNEQSVAQVEDTSSDEKEKKGEIQSYADTNANSEEQAVDESETHQDDTGISVKKNVNLEVNNSLENSLKEEQKSEEDENCVDNEHCDDTVENTLGTVFNIPLILGSGHKSACDEEKNKEVKLQHYDDAQDYLEREIEDASQKEKDDTGVSIVDDVVLEADVFLDKSSKEKHVFPKYEQPESENLNLLSIAGQIPQILRSGDKHSSDNEDDEKEEIQSWDQALEMPAKQTNDVSETKEDDTGIQILSDTALEVNISLNKLSEEKQVSAEDEDLYSDAGDTLSFAVEIPQRLRHGNESVSDKDNNKKNKIELCADAQDIPEAQVEDIIETSKDDTDVVTKDFIAKKKHIFLDNSTTEKHSSQKVNHLEKNEEIQSDNGKEIEKINNFIQESEVDVVEETKTQIIGDLKVPHTEEQNEEENIEIEEVRSRYEIQEKLEYRRLPALKYDPMEKKQDDTEETIRSFTKENIGGGTIPLEQFLKEKEVIQNENQASSVDLDLNNMKSITDLIKNSSEKGIATVDDVINKIADQLEVSNRNGEYPAEIVKVDTQEVAAQRKEYSFKPDELNLDAYDSKPNRKISPKFMWQLIDNIILTNYDDKHSFQEDKTPNFENSLKQVKLDKNPVDNPEKMDKNEVNESSKHNNYGIHEEIENESGSSVEMNADELDGNARRILGSYDVFRSNQENDKVKIVKYIEADRTAEAQSYEEVKDIPEKQRQDSIGRIHSFDTFFNDDEILKVEVEGIPSQMMHKQMPFIKPVEGQRKNTQLQDESEIFLSDAEEVTEMYDYNPEGKQDSARNTFSKDSVYEIDSEVGKKNDAIANTNKTEKGFLELKYDPAEGHQNDTVPIFNKDEKVPLDDIVRNQ